MFLEPCLACFDTWPLTLAHVVVMIDVMIIVTTMGTPCFGRHSARRVRRMAIARQAQHTGKWVYGDTATPDAPLHKHLNVLAFFAVVGGRVRPIAICAISMGHVPGMAIIPQSCNRQRRSIRAGIPMGQMRNRAHAVCVMACPARTVLHDRLLIAREGGQHALLIGMMTVTWPAVWPDSATRIQVFVNTRSRGCFVFAQEGAGNSRGRYGSYRCHFAHRLSIFLYPLQFRGIPWGRPAPR